MPAGSTISGALPDSRRKLFVYGSMAAFIVVGTFSALTMWPLVSRIHSIPLPILLLYGAISAMAIASYLQVRNRVITQFDYDGSTLYYRTAGHPETRTLPMVDLHKIKDWRTKGGTLGFILVFRDGQKLNVDFALANSDALIARLRKDRWPENPPSL